RQEGVTLRIDLPSRYPFERPVVTVETPIFHPNVFASGVVCQGERWLPGEGFDIFVRRMIGLVTFAPGTVNPASAANRAAAAWSGTAPRAPRACGCRQASGAWWRARPVAMNSTWRPDSPRDRTDRHGYPMDRRDARPAACGAATGRSPARPGRSRHLDRARG